MLAVPLHAGVEHPNLVWIVLSGLISFIVGLGLGTYSDRVRSVVRTLTAKTER